MSDLIGDWDKLDDILDPSRMKTKLVQAQKRVGVRAASAIKKGIRSGAPGGQTFKPLSAFTVWLKDSSKPLIDNGDLIGNITHEEPDDATVWVGVKRSAKGKGGNLANIAAVHEFGCTVRVTDKMRRGFAGKFRGLGIRRNTAFIHIPARPFLAPMLSDPELQGEIAETYLTALKEVFLP